MPFDQQLANAISNTFRATVANRLDSAQRGYFEALLQRIFGVKNLRNVQLWTRYGQVQRQFINNRLGEYELDLRTFLADRFVQPAFAMFPVKAKRFQLPVSNSDAKKFFDYLNDNYIREYCTRIFIEGTGIYIEYAADSDTPNQVPDLDSPEFDDVIED